MGLGFQGNNNSEGFMGDGFFVDQVKIKSAKDISQETTDFIQNPYDLAVEVEVAFLKNDWTRTLVFGGNFKREQLNDDDDSPAPVKDWGGAFIVRDFLKNTEVMNDNSQLEDDNTIPPERIDALIDKEFLMLSYPNNRGKTSTWNQIQSIEQEPQVFKEMFLKQWERRGYPKNYQPKNQTDVIPDNIVSDDEPIDF